MRQSFDDVPRPTVQIAEPVIMASQQLLQRPRWKRQHESIVYWAGVAATDRCIVTTVIAPDAETTWGSYRVCSTSNAAVINNISAHSLEVIAQVHTHPGDFVEHSHGDELGALMPYENFLSIVVPNYCRPGLLPLTECGVHRFEHSRFRQLSSSEIRQVFQVIPLIIDLRK
jgi:hypothetical protein